MSEMGDDRPVEAGDANSEAPGPAASEAGESGPAEAAGDAPDPEGPDVTGDQASEAPVAGDAAGPAETTDLEAGDTGPAETTDLEVGDAGPADAAAAGAEPGLAEPAGGQETGEPGAETASEPAAEAGAEADDAIPDVADTAEPAEAGESEPPAETGETGESGESDPSVDTPLDDVVNSGAAEGDAEAVEDSADTGQPAGEISEDPVAGSEPETTESVDAEAAATPDSIGGEGNGTDGDGGDGADGHGEADADSQEGEQGEQGEQADPELPSDEAESDDAEQEQDPDEQPEQEPDEQPEQETEEEPQEPDSEFGDVDGDEAPAAEDDPPREDEPPVSDPGQEGGFAARPGEAGSPLAGEQDDPGNADADEQRPDDGAEASGAEPGEAEPVVADDTEFAGRPSVADAHPDDYTPADHEPPQVDQPHESPEAWARDINHDENEPGHRTNCGECARAVQSTWEGEPAAAAAMADDDAKGEDLSRMVDWAGDRPQYASMSDINQRLDELGPGSSAIVGCTWPPSAPDLDPGGHWFNAVNDGGTVKAVDGQFGNVEPWPPTEDGLGFDESQMDRSFAIFFDRDGRVVGK